MRTKNMLLTAVVIGLAVVAGLCGVGGTWALWNASVQSAAGTVQAATFDIQVNRQSIPAGAQSVSVQLEDPAARLTPSTKVYAAVTLTNATNASTPLKVRADLGVPQPASSTASEMRQSLVLGTAPLTGGTCTSLAPTAYSTTAKTVQIAKGGSATYCVEVALKSSAPSTLSGKTVDVVLPLTVSQLPAGS